MAVGLEVDDSHLGRAVRRALDDQTVQPRLDSAPAQFRQLRPEGGLGERLRREDRRQFGRIEDSLHLLRHFAAVFVV